MYRTSSINDGMSGSSGLSDSAEAEQDELPAQEQVPTAIDVDKLIERIRAAIDADPETFLPFLNLFTLQGKPYTLERHFPMAPMFKRMMPKRSLWKCGRQVSKSTSLSAAAVISSIVHPFLRTLIVTPRRDQVTRLSNNYVRPLIYQALIRDVVVDKSCDRRVLQRSFKNNSVIFFSYALLDVDRVRGYSTDRIGLDEIQDIDYDFLPVINECMSHSELGLTLYSGTPKTLDNGMEALWEKSSQAEWVILCDCGYWNTPTLKEDLAKMIGRKTLVCRKCGKPLNPRTGHWKHFLGQEHPDFHGRHVPQAIMPLHYEDERKWGELLDKIEGRSPGYTEQKVINEVHGESADTSVKLITVTDIRNASKLNVNKLVDAANELRKYPLRAIGVDWGGGGLDEISYTAIAMVGYNSVLGRCECRFAFRFHAGLSHLEEARELLRFFNAIGAHWFAHDFGGSGSARETIMIQAGLPVDRTIGFCYTHMPTRDLVTYNKPSATVGGLRGYHSLDKARSLALMSISLKTKQILLPEYESSKDVTHDLLALIEDKHELPAGTDVYLIRRQPKMRDDFAHALNYACQALWHAEQRYPDLSAVGGFKLTASEVVLSRPPHPIAE